MRKITLFALVIAISALFVAGCGGRTASFGYVDMQKVFQESQKVKDLQAQMEAKQKELLEKAQQEEGTVPQEEFDKKQQERNIEFMAFSQDIQKQFETTLRQVIDEVAKEKGLGAVLVKDNVLSGGTDITDDIIKKIQ